MRFLAIVCLAGMCGLAITMLYHFSNKDETGSEEWALPYAVFLLITLTGSMGFGFAWNAERDRSIQVEKLKISYEKAKEKRIVSR